MSRLKNFRPVTLALASVLAACVALPASAINATGLAQQGSGSAFDGVYKGNVQSLAVHGDHCPAADHVAVEVRDGRFKLEWNEPTVFDVKIAADGTFYATTESTVRAEKHMTLVPTMQGRIDGTMLVADYGTRWCHYRLEAKQSPGL